MEAIIGRSRQRQSTQADHGWLATPSTQEQKRSGESKQLLLLVSWSPVRTSFRASTDPTWKRSSVVRGSVRAHRRIMAGSQHLLHGSKRDQEKANNCSSWSPGLR